MEQLKFKRLFLKEDYLGKKKGAEAFVVKQVGDIYGIRFKVTKGCSWCQGQLYHVTLLENEVDNKFIVI